MTSDLVNLAKAMVQKAKNAWTGTANPPAPPKRAKLDGRRGYGDEGIDHPDEPAPNRGSQK